MTKPYITAEKLYVTWSIVAVISIVFIPIILALTSSGGEQKPLIWLAYSLPYIFGGYGLLSILTSLLFKQWFKKHWFINVAIFAVVVFLFLLTID
ncbi:hypothetical protein [Rufibacter sp. LB8]|uniref:hypothetical protein n=1 Tax=Rufibacter sp. LB8 TaxID=2777781 RepID=UPI00178C2261|nr:hypothetical protein [Rufibacter sp. LB8]